MTSWSPEKARLRGTSGQVPGLLALSGSSSCLAGLPSHSAEAQRCHLLPREAREREGLGGEASFGVGQHPPTQLTWRGRGWAQDGAPLHASLRESRVH